MQAGMQIGVGRMQVGGAGRKMLWVGNKSARAGTQVVQPSFQKPLTGNIGVCYVSHLYLGLTVPVLEPSRAFLLLILSMYNTQNNIYNIFEGVLAISYESCTLGSTYTGSREANKGA